MTKTAPMLHAPFATPFHLSEAVVCAADALGLVRAEMGRILGFRCAEFTALYEGRAPLQAGSEAYRRGALFVRLYQVLHVSMAGETAQMVHWLRRRHKGLDDAPFYLIVDQGRLAEVVAYLEQQQSERSHAAPDN